MPFLYGNHIAEECESPAVCNICKERHPTSLHKMHKYPRNLATSNGSNKQPTTKPDLQENPETQSSQQNASDK